MSKPRDAKIALGMITRNLHDPQPAVRFLENARAHNHSVERLMVAYSHQVDPAALQTLEQYVQVDLLCARGDANLQRRLRALGLDTETIDAFLSVPSWKSHHEVPYGAYRNTIVLQALLAGLDFLLFFDTDVQPRVLISLQQGKAAWQEIDFVGAHLHALCQQDVAATTSDYSGYYIIPPMRFDGMADLLYGLGKGMALEYMQACQDHKCLNLGQVAPGPPTPTHKPLGGNLGLCLQQPWSLRPFFSTVYAYKGLCVKARGEDTLLGQALRDSELRMLDIDLRIFHDTYDGFPRVPDISQKNIRDRFYLACLGWIGRNPFMTWFLHRVGRLETRFESELNLQRDGLKVGGEKAAKYLKDDRFADLPAALEVSLGTLQHSIQRYKGLMQAWRKLIRTLRPDSPGMQFNQLDDQTFRLAS